MTQKTQELIESAATGNKEALSKVIEENLGLVRSAVRRFIGIAEYDDLFQVGCMGLVRSIHGFDTSRGVALSTYAVPAIIGEIKRYLRDNGPIKVSRSLKERAYKINQTKEALWATLGREPSISEIAERLDISVNELVEALEATATPVSIDLTYSDGEGGESGLIDCIGQSDNSDLSEVKQAIATLPPDDRKIVILRFFCDIDRKSVV